MADAFGLGGAQVGHALFALALATALGLVVVGPLDRALNTRKGVTLAMAGVETACFAVPAPVAESDARPCGALLFLALLCQTFYLPLAAHCRALFPDHLVGRANTTMNLSGILSVAFMQLLTGPLVRMFPSDSGVAEPIAYRLVSGLLAALIAAGAPIHDRIEDARPRP